MTGKATDGPTAAWAKRSRTGTRWHSLAAHAVDVALMFEALVSGSSVRHRLADLAGRPLSDTDVARLATLAGLHDAGKASHSFQACADLDADGWDKGRHCVEMLYAWRDPDGFGLRDKAETALGMPAMAGWFEGDGLVAAMEAALFRHHGESRIPREARHANPYAWDVRPWDRHLRDPFASMAAMRDAVADALPLTRRPGAPLAVTPLFADMLSGLVNEADVQASRRCPMADGAELADPAAYAARARDRLSWLASDRRPRRPAAGPVPDGSRTMGWLTDGEDPLATAVSMAETLSARGEVDGLLYVTTSPGEADRAEAALSSRSATPPRMLGREPVRGPLGDERRRRLGNHAVAHVGTLVAPLRADRHVARALADASRLLLVVEGADDVRGEHLATLSDFLGRHAALGGRSVALGRSFDHAQALAYAPHGAEVTGKPPGPTEVPSRPSAVLARVSTEGKPLEAAGVATLARLRGETVLVVRNTLALAERTARHAGTNPDGIASASLLHDALAPGRRAEAEAALARLRPDGRWARPTVIVAGPAAEHLPPLGVDRVVTDACPPDAMARRLAHLSGRDGHTPALTILSPPDVDLRDGRCAHIALGTGCLHGDLNGARALVEAVGWEGEAILDVGEWLETRAPAPAP